MAEQNHILILNMTNFFNRELFMYSLGDIRFKKPVSLKKAAYVLGFLLIWTLPMFLIFGIKLNPFYLVIALVPPIVLGNFAGKPVWGGKPLFDFIKTLVKFLQEPKGWTDLKNNKMDEEVYYSDSEIWVSRRRELQLLADLEESQIKRNIPVSKNKNTGKTKKVKRGKK